MAELHDMHCHLQFMANGLEVAADARAAGSLLFDNTVAPDEYADAHTRFAPFENVTVGFGMHPWWVAEDTDSSRVVEQLNAANPRFVGEIGLDFGKRHLHTRTQQVAVFEAIASWAAQKGGKAISLHSVHAAAEVLDVLQATGALEACACAFHWFTGPSDQLRRAIDAGCLFSVGPRMLATGKGREYVKAIPANRIMLETDAPPQQGQAYSYAALRAELESAAQGIAAIKGPETVDVMAQTSRMFLS